MEGGWTGLSPVGVPDSVVSRCPDGTQLAVLRVTGAKDKEVGACHGEAMSASAQGAGRVRWAPQEPQGTEGRKLAKGTQLHAVFTDSCCVPALCSSDLIRPEGQI